MSKTVGLTMGSRCETITYLDVARWHTAFTDKREEEEAAHQKKEFPGATEAKRKRPRGLRAPLSREDETHFSPL